MSAASPVPPRGQALVAQLRAGFVLFHILMVVVLSLPRPGQLDRPSAWEHPRIQRNFATGTRLLRRLGAAVDDDTLQAVTWDAAQLYLAARARAVVPFQPYAHWAGIGQGWRMFLTGRAEASRVHIDLRERGAYRPLYVRGSREYRWLARELDYHRFRKLCGWAVKEHDSEWHAFSRWLARRAAREFPGAVALRLRAYIFVVPEPDAARRGQAPEGRFEWEIVHKLAGFRP